ncbi:aspartyl/glutamyl-tRNA amidotransferase subunit C [Candidatus Amesbacteria bacterium]|nr:aspartyl/glutamyl-tRNA amidotransferase subunit C [Candidatus Amesbacteria bacterium]
MDVKKVAKLANLLISDDMAQKLQKDLDATVGLVDELAKLDLQNVVPTSQVTGLTNIMRDDVIDTTRILPTTGYFKVKAIFNES